MTASQKSRIAKIGIGILVALLVAGVAAHLWLTQRVKSILSEEIPAHIHLNYEGLTTNVFLGNIKLKNVKVQDSTTSFHLKAETVSLSGLKYLPLLQKGNITISEFLVESPQVTYQKKKTEHDSITSSQNQREPKNINIQNFRIHNGQLKLLQPDSDSTLAQLEGVEVLVTDIIHSAEIASQSLPFTFGEYEIETQKGYYDLGPLEDLQWQSAKLNTTEGSIQKLQLHTKYSWEELSKKLAVEHDHYNLVIDSVLLKQPDFGMTDHSPKFHLEALELHHPIFEVYRDKLLPDDTTHKKLYNQALRDLDFDLLVNTIHISEGMVAYEERLEADVEPESLRFTDISATIRNLHSKGSGMVSVAAQSQLMGDGQLTLDWSFDPQSQSNDFLASGSLKQFRTENISPFLRTNLGAEVKGTIDQMYFTISGNETESQGDMKMAYDQFEFVVLKKDKLGVNKLLTALVNIFAKESSKADRDGFRHGDFKVKRQPDKSFFNYLWLNVKSGLVDTMTGKGKQRKK
ncbi:DUF748 domain-containing protein [Allomuricauda sp. M10]|uniref:DUF748 domain-containing protein n=1 Tax=Allomuricauda sp. M10 TaxID=2683292 RepID=UPI001D17E968|nr:DUF748 domain-containing protein [Muricauda sp. M10]